MNWMDQIGGILQQYSGASPQSAPAQVHDDFDQFAQAAPPPAVADGLAAAFRDEQTPPFPQMLGQLFGRSDAPQRASILNTLVSTLGPPVVSLILSGGGGGAAGLGGLLGGLLGGQQEVSHEVARQVPPEAVEQMAHQAEQRDPSVIDQISNIYAEHPQLVKTLGGAALTIALAKIASRQG
jgi:hypothetical protein